MDSNIKGDIGEAAVILAATKKGYYVAKMPQHCPYDMVIDRGTGPERVQVKYCSLKNGAFIFKLTGKYQSSGRSYELGMLDAFVVYVPDNEQTYWIPFDRIETVEVMFRVDECKIANKRSRLAAEFAVW